MQNFPTKVFEISIYSLFLVLNQLPHTINISLLVAEQKDKFSRVQIILIDSVSRVYW